MRILHTADWHLGKRLDHINRLDEQKKVLAEIVQIADQEAVDAVLIAGDLFDTYNPAVEAVDLFYKTLKQLSRRGQCAVIAIAGNHDSPDRIEAPDPIARESGIVLSGYPNSIHSKFELSTGLAVVKSAAGFLELTLPKVNFPLRIITTPYANEYRLKQFLGDESPEAALREVLMDHWGRLTEEYCHPDGLNILISHLFFAKDSHAVAIEPEEEKPILHVGGAQIIYPQAVPIGIDYVALGHLHRAHQVDTHPCPIIYSGSPLAYSFSESGQQKSVVLIDAPTPNELVHQMIPLHSGKKVVRGKCRGVEEALTWLKDYPDAIVELRILTDTYLTAEEKKRLYALNADVFIVPELLHQQHLETSGKQVNLDQHIDALFIDFFKEKSGGLSPSEEILDLFKEVVGSQENNLENK